MKKLLLLSIVGAVVVFTSCGSEEKKEEPPTFCDCIKDGPPPAGCDKIIPKDMDPEEFSRKREECGEK